MNCHTSSIANTFFSIGLLIIALEGFLFNEVAGLAHSKYWIKGFISYNLFPSEIWFMLIGNFIVFLFLVKSRFILPKYIITNSIPLIIITGVYYAGFIYGLFNENEHAIRDFREIGFSALSLPGILYLSTKIDIKKVLKPFMIAMISFSIIWSCLVIMNHFQNIYENIHWSFSLLIPFPLIYYLSSFFLKKRTKCLSIFFVMILICALVVSFTKPSIAMLFAVLLMTIFLVHYTSNRIHKILYLHKIILSFSCLIIMVALFGYYVNLYSEGSVERIFHYAYMKERLDEHGQIRYGDISGGRFAIWAASLEHWSTSPLIGHGLGSTIWVYSSGWVEKFQLHNIIFQTLQNTGIIGLSLVLCGWFSWLKQSLRKARSVADPDLKIILVSMVAYVFVMLSYTFYGHPLSFPPVAQFFWLCAGLVCTVRLNLGQGIQDETSFHP